MSGTIELGELLNQLKKNAGNAVNTPAANENTENRPSEHDIAGGPSAPAAFPVSEPVPQTQTSPDAEKELTASSDEKDLPVTDADEEDIDTLLTGKPILGFTQKKRVSNGSKKKNLPPEKDVPEPAVRLNGIEDVEACWDRFLDRLKKNGSKTLFHQMEAVQLKTLKGTELVVSVNNMFAVNLLEEHRVFLSSLLKETVGIHNRLKCVVEREKKASAESLNPYDRFRELQKKDAHLKTIVELFGAELEY